MKLAVVQSLAKGIVLAALLLTPAMLAPVAVESAHAADSTAFFGSPGGGRVVQLGIGKSYVVDLPADASEVLVADPKIANAVVRSARKAYVIGITLGETDIIFFDGAGQQIESLAVSVARDLSPIRNNIQTSIPGSSVRANAVGESVMLTGSVRSAGEAQTAVDIAANLVGSPDKVVNALAIEGREQVMLKVSVVEMQRSVIKQIGAKWDIGSRSGNGVVGFGSNPGFLVNDTAPGTVLNPLNGNHLVGGNALGLGFDNGNTFAYLNVEALESSGLARVLAEPNLTAVSGEKAEFLAGGEFPVPVSGDNNTITLEFKKFGVGLLFTPIVLSSGRISLQVGTEVSELSNEGAVEQGGFRVPGLTVRRASTTVEMPSGGSFAIAGMLRDDTRQSFEGLPGLINLPVLGSLFRSRDYKRGQSELVIIVTPYLAKSVGRDKLAKPDDGFSTPDDGETVLLGRLNKIYAPGLKLAPGGYRGPIGHIVE
jgi:pilus assembly protein CpaC